VFEKSEIKGFQMIKDVFITENFLLSTDSAITLYHDYAKNLPIIDYHCHLSPKQVADNYRFTNMTDIWLRGDHYKWRIMRSWGVDERFITGDASDWEKFEKWAEVVPHTLRNPMYHWVHLELNHPFGISDRLLSPQTAKSIWDEGNAKLARPEFSARGLMKQMNVALACTTDDPTDSLEYHQAVANDDSFKIQMLPTFRPDKGMAVESPETFNAWVDKLAQIAKVDIKNFASYLTALRRRHDFFHQIGCRLSDHGLETIYAEPYTDSEIVAIFNKVRSGSTLTLEEILKFKSVMLHHFAVMDFEKGWTQQIHYGAIRNNNTRMFQKLGPDTGFDSIGDLPVAKVLSQFMDRLEQNNQLPKTILYNLNPADNEIMATMLGNFQGGGIRGKIQFGSGWWFLDQLHGMTQQIEALSNMGLLAAFVGMLTDSRSFLSYTRHEYFRRLLCNILGQEMESGLLPKDFSLLGGMVKDICYNNAARYFGFNLPIYE
jgi:glucuronate isomerase